MTELRCIICDEEAGAIGDDGCWQMTRSLVFASHGNYGSRIFDPAGWRREDPPRLIVAICDACVTQRLASVLAEQVERPRPVWRYSSLQSLDDIPD